MMALGTPMTKRKAPKISGEADGSPQHFDLSAEDPELEAGPGMVGQGKTNEKTNVQMGFSIPGSSK